MLYSENQRGDPQVGLRLLPERKVYHAQRRLWPSPHDPDGLDPAPGFPARRVCWGPAWPGFQSPPATPTQPPSPPETPTKPSPTLAPTLTPLPTKGPVATSTPVALCTFGPPVPPEPGPSLDAYVFSEPSVVLTHTSGIGIIGWLPDGQRLLITRDIPGTNRQAIETLNIRTAEIQVYGQREGANGKPVWLSGLGGVAYSTLAGQHHELWLSWGDPARAERIASRVEGLSLIADPTGQRLLYFPSLVSGQPRLLDVASRVEQAMPLNVAQWQYPKYPKLVQSMLTPSAFRIAWHPDGSQLAFYTQPWTFLFDMRTNEVCEIDLGQSEPENMPIWALEAKWSPNGRYLALITTGTFPGQASGTGAAILYTDLTILDMRTGNLRTLQPAPDINGGEHYVTDMSWAPDSHYLAVLGVVRITETGSEKEGIFIVDVTRGEFQRVLSEHDFGGGSWGWQLAWDPSGSQLAVNCPTPEEGRLCIISVRPKDVQGKQP